MRVLLCDDHRLFAESFAAMLISLGHEVVGIVPFPSPEPARERETAARAVLDADVCVVDPGTADLVELSEGLRVLQGSPAEGGEHTQACPFVVLTAEDRQSADGLRSLLEARIRGVVSKRRSAAEIIEALNVVHSGGIYFDPDLLRRALVTQGAAAGARPYSMPYSANLLTQRELEVLGWLVHGAATGEMAAAMGISAATVRSHVKAAMSKLGVSSRLQAAARAISLGLVEPPVGC